MSFQICLPQGAVSASNQVVEQILVAVLALVEAVNSRPNFGSC